MNSHFTTTIEDLADTAFLISISSNSEIKVTKSEPLMIAGLDLVKIHVCIIDIGLNINFN